MYSCIFTRFASLREDNGRNERTLGYLNASLSYRRVVKSIEKVTIISERLSVLT